MHISFVCLPDRLFRWPVSSFLHLLPDFGYFGRSLAFLAWLLSVWQNNNKNVVVVVVVA